MCRLLFVHSQTPFEIRPHLEAFAHLAQRSREYQGHGWGMAYLEKDKWEIYRNINPVWEDDLSRPGSTTLLLAHARSAFKNENIQVENNMPFRKGGDLFIFNGELHGVKVKSQGRTGAEKIFNYIRRLDRGDLLEASKKAMDILCQRSAHIRAMNLILGNRDRMILCSLFREDPDYFTLHKKKDKNLSIVCSDKYPKEDGWTPIENNTIEVLL